MSPDASAAAEVLAAWQNAADAATDGPWKVVDLRNAPDGNRDCLWVDVDNGRQIKTVAELTEDGGAEIIWTLSDAEFIALSRDALPRAVAALQAVLALHTPSPRWVIGRSDTAVICETCTNHVPALSQAVLYPCPTAAAIVAALGVEP